MAPTGQPGTPAPAEQPGGMAPTRKPGTSTPTKRPKGSKKKKKSDPRKEIRDMLSFQENFVAIAVQYFGGLASKIQKKMPSVTEDLLMSSYFIAPEAFISLILFIAILSIPAAAAGVAMYFVSGELAFLALIMAPPIILGIGLYLPKSSRSSRASAVDGELAFTIGYLSVLLSGGVSPIELFRRLSKSKLFPACAKEARRILLNIDILALDPVTAIERAAKYTPNKVLSDFLAGYIAVIKIGGDIRSFMDQKQKEVFNHRHLKLKSSIEFVGTLAEAYLSATVVMGISLFVMQVVEGMVSRTEFNFNMIYLYAGVLMPVISGVFIFLLHSIQAKEPMSKIRVHLVFLATMGIVPLMLFVVPLDQPDYMKLGIGLAIATTPPAIMSSIEAKRKQAAEKMLPSFVLDLAEVRKTGLAPEKCIQALAGRNYGVLTTQINRMSTQLSWGVPLSKVLEDLGKGVNSWFVSAVGFILLEVVEVGGGTAGLFNSMADFTQRSRELEKERTTLFRPYIFMPYIGAVLTVASTVLIISLLTSQLSTLASQGTGIVSVRTDTKTLTEVMLMAAIFQGWMMGIVGGKMAEQSLGAGYKHATLLAVISMITVYVVTNYIKL